MTLKTCFSVAAMLACQSVLAAGTPLLSASGSVGNLSYRLIDLDLSDGIAAGVVFAPSTGGSLSVSDAIANNAHQHESTIESNFTALQGAPFSSALSGSAALSDGRASVTSANGVLSGTTGYDAAYLNALVSGAAPGAYASRYQTVFAQLPQNLDFTLTANTRIEFLANVTLSTQIDIAALQAYSAKDLFSVTASTSVFGYAFGDGTYGLPTDVTYSTPLASRTVSFKAGSVAFDQSSNPAKVFDLFMSVSNNTATTREGHMDISLSNQVSATLSPQLAVPEAGTWALFGLGLIGLAAATRRQRLLAAR